MILDIALIVVFFGWFLLIGKEHLTEETPYIKHYKTEKIENRTEVTMKQNIFNPKNWTFFCFQNFFVSIFLIIDWIIRLSYTSNVIRRSFLLIIFPNNDFLLWIFPLICSITILCLSPLLNDKLDRSPFYTAISILLLIYLGINEYTILGRIGVFVLSLGNSIILVLILINITILENDKPLRNTGALLIGIVLISINFCVMFLVYGFKINVVWGVIYIVVAILGLLIIRQEHILIGAVVIFIFSLLNDYFVPYGLDGFGPGSDLLKFISLFLIIFCLRK